MQSYLNTALEIPWMFEIYLFIVGLVIGSFLNVCIYRIPLKQSFISPRSHCPSCNTTIKWYHNVPLISYIFLRGRCSKCGARISPVYPFVELITAVLIVLLWRMFGPTMPFLIYSLFAGIMIVLIFIDFYHQILPHRITFPGIVLGFGSSFVNPYVTPLESALGILAGGLLPFIVLVVYKWIRKKEGLGHGDVFMLALIGAFLGWRQVLIVLFLSSLVGSIIGLLIIFFWKKTSDFALPYGTFLGAAALFAIFFGRFIWSAYFRL
jgi:leader peptidase (prepilin peptidase)/N-methyltransferase